MAWSAKLQSGSGGVAGYNEFEMVYDAASQTAYKLKYGFNLGNQSPDVLYHTPDNGSPDIRHTASSGLGHDSQQDVGHCSPRGRAIFSGSAGANSRRR